MSKFIRVLGASRHCDEVENFGTKGIYGSVHQYDDSIVNGYLF